MGDGGGGGGGEKARVKNGNDLDGNGWLQERGKGEHFHRNLISRAIISISVIRL